MIKFVIERTRSMQENTRGSHFHKKCLSGQLVYGHAKPTPTYVLCMYTSTRLSSYVSRFTVGLYPPVSLALPG